MIRIGCLVLLTTVAACSGSDEPEHNAVSCLAQVEALLAERGEFFAAQMRELGLEFDAKPEMGEIIEDRSAALEGNSEADLAKAIQALRELHENRSLEDMQKWAQFVNEVEHYENRIRTEVQRCPEAAGLIENADRQVPLRVKMP